MIDYLNEVILAKKLKALIGFRVFWRFDGTVYKGTIDSFTFGSQGLVFHVKRIVFNTMHNLYYCDYKKTWFKDWYSLTSMKTLFDFTHSPEAQEEL